MNNILDFQVEDTELPGVLKIINNVFFDKRGEIWSGLTKDQALFFKKKNLYFTHVKFNKNKKNVLRGIHYDNESSKLVSCLAGSLTQIVININKADKNYGKYLEFELKGADGISILIPAGYGNAFVSRENNTVYCYIMSYPDTYPDVERQKTIRYDDNKLKINWRVDNPILSERDS